MKSLVDHLSQYAAYHRDPRNIASHFIGIPLIVVAVAVLLSRPEWPLGGLWLSPAVIVRGGFRLHKLSARLVVSRGEYIVMKTGLRYVAAIKRHRRPRVPGRE